MHICFSDYISLFPHIKAMDECCELQLEFSNRHFRELGTKAEDRPGYDLLERLAASAWPREAYSGTQDRTDNPHLQAGRSIARNSEATITAMNCIVNFIVIEPVDGGATSEVSLPGTMKSILPPAVGATNISATPIGEILK